MTRTLITGMSGTGKSSTIARLSELGHQAVDLDSPAWSHDAPDDSAYADRGSGEVTDWRWREDAVRELVASPKSRALYVAGTSTNQADLYPLLDHIVLLSVPEEVARERLAHRTTNDYGKAPDELARELHLRGIVEPLLRKGACLEIDTSHHGVDDVVEMVLAHATVTSCARADGPGRPRCV
jgi:broad-specificity NMP kinase